MNTQHLLAVYGTLRKGYGNHRLLNGARFIRDQWLAGFIMCGTSIPFVFSSRLPGQEIKIEIYEVDQKTLERIDRLEGHPNWYRREMVETDVGRAWIYLVQEDGVRHMPIIKSGDWETDWET